GLVPVDWTIPTNHRREWQKLLKVLGATKFTVKEPGPLLPDVQDVGDAQHGAIENQNFFGSTPVAQPQDDPASSSSWERVAHLPLWHVPYPRNPHFTGRLEVIARLEAELRSGQAAAVTQAIAGLGGIGKTQLALEYCYRQAS